MLYLINNINVVFNNEFDKNNDYISLVNRLDTNNNRLKKFCMISNCTVNAFVAQYVGGKHGPEIYGLDGWIYYARTESLGYVTNTFEKIINNEKSSTIANTCMILFHQVVRAAHFFHVIGVDIQQLIHGDNSKNGDPCVRICARFCGIHMIRLLPTSSQMRLLIEHPTQEFKNFAKHV